MASVADIQSTVRRLHAELNETAKKVEPQALHFHPDENAWSVAQILAHVAEFENFFTTDVLRLRENPGSRFGRTMEHEERLQAVQLTGQETPEDLLGRVAESEQVTLSRLGELTDADLSVTGTHPKFGEQTIEWELGHFITEHLEKHIGQLQRTHAAYHAAHS